MAGKSKFFRVATEGDTTDGRKIERSWIQQAAKNFNQAKYGARVWLEHIRGLLPDSPFRAYGDVAALKAEEVEDGKLALFAQIEPTSDLVAMNKAKQKLYTSIELDPDFAGSGEAYMVGLAVTDSPASLGTEMLAFSANAQHNPLAARKQKPGNVFTAAIETQLEFEEESEGPGLFSRVKELLGKAREKTKADFSDIGKAVEAVAEQTADNTEQVSQFANQLGEFKSTLAELKTLQERVSADFNQLKTQLDNEPGSTSRPLATGGNGTITTDC